MLSLQVSEVRRTLRRVPVAQLFSGRASYRFDESLELLQDIVAPTGYDVSAPASTLMQVSLSTDGVSRSVGGAGPLSPKLFEWALDHQLNEMRHSGTLTITSEGVDEPVVAAAIGPHGNFLKNFAEAAGFARAELVLRVLRAEPTDTAITYLLGAATFQLRTKRGGAVSHELLSYGQKRLLSFLYYVACNDTFVVADELVNGLHHAWIEVCLDAIGERQAFLTSQNPILLDFLPPASPEEAERRFIRCVPEERGGRDVMVWRNLTPDEAREFCEEYAVGVQQVSELLRVQGLW